MRTEDSNRNAPLADIPAFAILKSPEPSETSTSAVQVSSTSTLSSESWDEIRKQALGAAAEEAQAHFADISTDDQAQLHDSEYFQKPNKVRMNQGIPRREKGCVDAETYHGVKYERKVRGPFAGKLTTQGTIISIDGRDYVEYRVLTEPSVI